jgi:DNA-binding MarR family transcriptional regulator
MNGLIGGRTASDMPGLDIAELRSWQNFLDAALRLSAALNASLVDHHGLTLIEVRLLDILNTSPTGSARMGDLAEALLSSPSRATRLVGRLERRGLVRREASPADGRSVLATITGQGRMAAEQTMITYGDGIRTHYLDQLSRSQMVAIGENCRRINAALRLAAPPTRFG